MKITHLNKINFVIRSIEQEIRDCWYGRQVASKVFWIYKIVVPLLITLLGSLVLHRSSKAFSAFIALDLVYNIWVLVSLWRCAYNSKRAVKVVAILLRSYVCLAAVALSFSLSVFFYEKITGKTPDFIQTIKQSNFLKTNKGL